MPESSSYRDNPCRHDGQAVRIFTGISFPAAAAGGAQLAVVPVHPLPPGDRNGAVSFLVVMALVVGGYLSATIATTIGGPATHRWRAPVLAGVAVIGSLATDLVAGPLLGAIPTDKFFVLWALFAFVMLAVAWAAAALQALFGPVGTLIVIVVFVIFGAPAAGGTVPRPFLPSFWGTIGPYLPPGAGTTAVRNTIYFGGNGIGRALVVLAVYLLVGGAIVVRVRRKASAQALDAESEAAAGAAAVVV